MHQLAYNWLAEMLSRAQNPVLANRKPLPHAMGVPQDMLGGMPSYPTNNWVAPPMGQTPLGIQAGPGQADLATMQKMRGW